MQKVYASLKKDTRYHGAEHTALIVVLGFMIFISITWFMRSAFNERREELIERLHKEKEVSALNEKLKVELSGIMRGRYIELKAKERLGLKKPKEEEVLVLRHE